LTSFAGSRFSFGWEPYRFGARLYRFQLKVEWHFSKRCCKKGGFKMDSTTLIRVVAGVLFVVVLVILVQRRRTRVK
jgi:hypothetical protein